MAMATVRLIDALIDYAQWSRRQGAREWALSPAARRGLAKVCREAKCVRPMGLATSSAHAPAPSSEPAAPIVEPLAHPLDCAGLTAADRLAHLRERASVCQKCQHLARTRTQVVFGVGNPAAELMFVGEAPGAEEDAQGEPFVGQAGQLLTKMIETMGMARSDVYIANVLKCRPDVPPGSYGNRPPTNEEMATCLPYLLGQIDIVRPKILVALGTTAVRGLLPHLEETPIGRLRGKFAEFRGVPLMPTFHPSYVLRQGDNATKRKVWEDLLMVMEKLGMPISAKQRGYFVSKP
jgi:DNA polymerase